MDALGYPTQDTLDFARHASVSSYVDRIRIPTLLVQGQNDTLFNLQEAAATYRALRAQGTPVKMIWQSWGHSGGGSPGAGRARHGAPARQLRGPPDHAPGSTTTSRRKASAPARGSRTSATGCRTTASPRRPTAPRRRYPVGTTQDLYLSGTDSAGDVEGRRRCPAARRTPTSPARRRTSYSEVSALQGAAGAGRRHPAVRHPRHVRRLDDDAAGRRRSSSVGVPTLTLRLSSPRGRADPGRPGRPGSCCSSRRSTTSRRTAPRRWCTGWSRPRASPTSPSR